MNESPTLSDDGLLLDVEGTSPSQQTEASSSSELRGPPQDHPHDDDDDNHHPNEHQQQQQQQQQQEQEQQSHHHLHGSSVAGAIMNFTNSVVGAGAIGLGGAIADSGGIVSIVAILVFALLTKRSLDLLIRLSVATPGAHGSYEDLGHVAFGLFGLLFVMISKFLYSFGCLVAYVIVVKDNLGDAIQSLVFGNNDDPHDSFLYNFLGDKVWVTWTVSFVVILPLCLLRDMTPLASASVVSIISMVCIVTIVAYLYMFNPHDEIRQPGRTVYENWFQIRWAGFFECLGTFVFTFVSQHTAHLTFESLKPSARTVQNWERISTYAIAISAAVSLAIGVLVYMTFWEATKSDIFEIYPAIPIIDLAKLLLCITMLFTFPLPFFTCRELLIVLCTSFGATSNDNNRYIERTQQQHDGEVSSLQEPLLSDQDESCISDDNQDTEDAQSLGVGNGTSSLLLPGEDKQLKLPYHVAMTVVLWIVVTWLAVAAPSLGDVLDLVGCASGTLIAFIFPAFLAFFLEGYSHTAALILVVGGLVGIIGTFFSFKKLIEDV